MTTRQPLSTRSRIYLDAAFPWTTWLRIRVSTHIVGCKHLNQKCRFSDLCCPIGNVAWLRNSYAGKNHWPGNQGLDTRGALARAGLTLGGLANGFTFGFLGCWLLQSQSNVGRFEKAAAVGRSRDVFSPATSTVR